MRKITGIMILLVFLVGCSMQKPLLPIDKAQVDCEEGDEDCKLQNLLNSYDFEYSDGIKTPSGKYYFTKDEFILILDIESEVSGKYNLIVDLGTPSYHEIVDIRKGHNEFRIPFQKGLFKSEKYEVSIRINKLNWDLIYDNPVLFELDFTDMNFKTPINLSIKGHDYIDTDKDGKFDFLRINFTADVNNANDYYINCFLYQQSRGGSHVGRADILLKNLKKGQSDFYLDWDFDEVIRRTNSDIHKVSIQIYHGGRGGSLELLGIDYHISYNDLR